MSNPFLRGWIQTSIDSLGLPITLESEGFAKTLHASIRPRNDLRPGDECGWLWDRKRARPGYQPDDPVAELCSRLPSSSLLLFFDVFESPDVWRVTSPDVLQQLLDDTPGYEFYVTDEVLEWIIALNHHDFIICNDAFEALSEG